MMTKYHHSRHLSIFLTVLLFGVVLYVSPFLTMFKSLLLTQAAETVNICKSVTISCAPEEGLIECGLRQSYTNVFSTEIECKEWLVDAVKQGCSVDTGKGEGCFCQIQSGVGVTSQCGSGLKCEPTAGAAPDEGVCKATTSGSPAQTCTTLGATKCENDGTKLKCTQVPAGLVWTNTNETCLSSSSQACTTSGATKCENSINYVCQATLGTSQLFWTANGGANDGACDTRTPYEKCVDTCQTSGNLNLATCQMECQDQTSSGGGTTTTFNSSCREFDSPAKCTAGINAQYCYWAGGATTGVCQMKGEGSTYGAVGDCKDQFGNPTDAVCHYCDGFIPSGGCNQSGANTQLFDVNGGKVPNASSMGNKVNYCGMVQCDCKGTGAGSNYAIPMVFTSQVFTSGANCSLGSSTGGPTTTPTYACVNGVCQTVTMSTPNSYGTMAACQSSCTPPPPPPPGSTPPPPQPPGYHCDSPCDGGAAGNTQCQTNDSRLSCVSTAQGNRCRLTTNPSSTNCQSAAGPMCLSLNLRNITRPNDPANNDPKPGDAIQLTCGQVAGISRYTFRVIEPNGNIKKLAATGQVSEPYVVLANGQYSAQCQICTGQDDASCLPFENPAHSPVGVSGGSSAGGSGSVIRDDGTKSTLPAPSGFTTGFSPPPGGRLLYPDQNQ